MRPVREVRIWFPRGLISRWEFLGPQGISQKSRRRFLSHGFLLCARADRPLTSTAAKSASLSRMRCCQHRAPAQRTKRRSNEPKSFSFVCCFSFSFSVKHLFIISIFFTLRLDVFYPNQTHKFIARGMIADKLMLSRVLIVSGDILCAPGGVDVAKVSLRSPAGEGLVLSGERRHGSGGS